MSSSLTSSAVHPHSSPTATPPALALHNVSKSYGKVPALNDINLEIASGTIYALLGPSGCGKTTLIQSCVGLLSCEGTVNILGRTPATLEGKQIGYQPQATALYEDFTIYQNLKYYALMYGMSAEQLKERSEFLSNLLHLPDMHKQKCKQLSGGQQRRCSFAIALLHEPALLLLDEPTVGLDPMLRSNIWKHLRELCRTKGTTIAITTHYIDEARAADTCGFMRNGVILREGNPQQLMTEMSCDNLEDVFLKLCNEGDDSDSSEEKANGDDKVFRSPYTPARNLQSTKASTNGNGITSNERQRSTHIQINDTDVTGSLKQPLLDDHDADESDQPPSKFTSWLPRWQQTWALIWRNLTRAKMSPAFLLFQFALPSLQIALFCYCIGGSPIGLKFAVVNGDSPNGIGDQLINKLEHTQHPMQILQYNDADTAYDAVKQGDAWGYLNIPQNFTTSLFARFAGQDNSTYTLEHSVMKYQLDMSNQQIDAYIGGQMLESVQALINDYNPDLLKYSPLQAGEAVYGPKNKQPSFTDFIGPGMIINTAFSQAIGLTALAFVIDKRMGLLDRTWVAGVNVAEILLSQLLTQIVILAVQLFLLLSLALWLFSLPCEGSIVLLYTVCMFLGLSGMLLGLAVSAYCDDEREALQIVLGATFPFMLISGVIWPIEAIPWPLNKIALSVPLTHAAGAARSIMSRGWSIDHQDVWLFFVVCTVWSLVGFVVSSSGLKRSK